MLFVDRVWKQVVCALENVLQNTSHCTLTAVQDCDFGYIVVLKSTLHIATETATLTF